MGTTTDIIVDKKTAIVGPGDGAMSDSKPGKAVFLRANKGADGSLSANNVTVEKTASSRRCDRPPYGDRPKMTARRYRAPRGFSCRQPTKEDEMRQLFLAAALLAAFSTSPFAPVA